MVQYEDPLISSSCAQVVFRLIQSYGRMEPTAKELLSSKQILKASLAMSTLLMCKMS